MFPVLRIRSAVRWSRERFEDVALEIGGYVEAEEPEDRRGDVHQLHAGHRPLRRDAGPGRDQQAIGGVIGIVGAGIVLERMDLACPDRAH